MVFWRPGNWPCVWCNSFYVPLHHSNWGPPLQEIQIILEYPKNHCLFGQMSIKLLVRRAITIMYILSQFWITIPSRKCKLLSLCRPKLLWGWKRLCRLLIFNYLSSSDNSELQWLPVRLVLPGQGLRQVIRHESRLISIEKVFRCRSPAAPWSPLIWTHWTSRYPTRPPALRTISRSCLLLCPTAWTTWCWRATLCIDHDKM